MDTLAFDLRQAARTLARRPGFAAVAVLTLALGIGANSALFSVVHAVLLRPLPYRAPERLVWVNNRVPELDLDLVGAADYLEWRDASRTLDAIAAYDTTSFTLTGRETPENVRIARVSAGFLPLLGVQPERGRGFLPTEERLNAGRVTVLSRRLWDRLYGQGVEVGAQTLMLDGDAYAVAGVLPRDFRFPGDSNVEALVPLTLDETVERGRRQMSIVSVIARLRPGMAPEQARAELASIRKRAEDEALRAEAAAPEAGPRPGGPAAQAAPGPASPGGMAPPLPGRSSAIQIRRMGPPGGGGPRPGGPRLGMPEARVEVVPLHRHLVGDVRPALLLLFAAVGLVLLIACANVANLLLARATARQGEIAVRAALGAGRWRIVRLLLAESVLLGLLGGGCGLLLAFAGVRILLARMPAELSGGLLGQAPIGIDGTVLLFTLGLSLATALLFGLAPAMAASRPDLQDPLKEGSRRRSTAARGLLVAGEVALAAVLLIGAGLLLRSFLRVLTVDLGFRPERVLTLTVDLDPRRHSSPAAQNAFFEEGAERLRSRPGVEAVSYGDSVPLSGRMLMILRGMQAEGAPPPDPERQRDVAINAVGPDYFHALGIPVLKGRPITEGDGATAMPVAVVNQTFARHFWGNEDPIGKRFRGGPRSPSWITVVGVVPDVRHDGLEEAPRARIYRPFAQEPRPFGFLALRTSTDPVALASAVRREVSELDPNAPVFDVATMEQRLAGSLAERRFGLSLLGLFALVALVLSAVGLYGVLAYAVAERTHEIGVRLALGAARSRVLRLVLRQGLTLAAAGAAAGLAVASVSSRALASALYGVPPTDPLTFALIPLVLLAVSLLASWLPARRATQVDPMVALRTE